MYNERTVMQLVAEREMKNNKDVLYYYDIIEGLYTGICKIIHISYNPLFKSFDLVLEDIDTNNTMCISRCCINLKRRAK